MTHLFTQAMPTLDNYWRSIVLFGQNTACYKFALAQALLEKAQAGVSEVPLNTLAEVYADHICQCDARVWRDGKKALRAKIKHL